MKIQFWVRGTQVSGLDYLVRCLPSRPNHLRNINIALAGNRLKIRVCVGIEINLTLVSLESACELKKKHSSCHRAKFHEIELFPFISRFFKKKTLQIQKGIQVQFHDFLMIFFQYNFRLYFYPKTLKLILLPKQKKIFETKSTFQRWSNWSLLWWDAFL